MLCGASELHSGSICHVGELQDDDAAAAAAVTVVVTTLHAK